MVKVYIKSLKRTPKISKRKLKSIALRVLELESVLNAPDKDYEIEVTLVDDKYIRKLNKKYRNVNSTTDVLAFPIEVIYENRKPKPKNLFLGDIYISIDRAGQQVQKKENLETEVSRLLIHGILHLLGYDHSEQMFNKQEYYLSLGREE